MAPRCCGGGVPSSRWRALRCLLPRHAEWLAGREAFLSNLDNSHRDESRALGHSALWLLLRLLGLSQHAPQWHSRDYPNIQVVSMTVAATTRPGTDATHKTRLTRRHSGSPTACGEWRLPCPGTHLPHAPCHLQHTTGKHTQEHVSHGWTPEPWTRCKGFLESTQGRERPLGDGGKARRNSDMASRGHASERGRRERPVSVCAPPGAAGEW